MFGIIWTIVSYVLGSLLRMWERKQENDLEIRRAELIKMGMQLEDLQSARKIQTSEAQFTRRIVMIVMTLALVFIMLWGVVHGGGMVQPILTTHEASGFFSFIFGGGTSTEIDFIAVPLTMTVSLAWELFGIMVGFYFGSGGTRR